MGAQNVAKVFANWRHLGHREARALTFMANIALDADNPPVYFGGWVAVAEALGLDPEGKRASAQEVFRQTIAALVAAGAVVSSGQARLRVRAEYALALDPAETYEALDSGRSGNGRGISWTSVPREASRQSRESSKRGNDSLPHLPQRNVAPYPNDSLPHVPQQIIGNSPNDSLPPRSTEEPQGGIPEETHGGITIQASYVTREPPRTRTRAITELNGNLTLEDERARQMAGLRELQKKMDAEEKEAS
jgi:hypothetical protein